MILLQTKYPQFQHPLNEIAVWYTKGNYLVVDEIVCENMLEIGISSPVQCGHGLLKDPRVISFRK
jgi:hypothetical protein